MKWIDWNYMERKKDTVFDEVIKMYEARNVKKIMGFKHGWNEELIAQFYFAMRCCIGALKETIFMCLVGSLSQFLGLMMKILPRRICMEVGH